MAANKKEFWELAPGDIVDKKHTIIDQLGRGNYSLVYLASSTGITKHNTNRLVVLKVLKPSPTSPFGVSDFEEKLARNEIATLRREHKGVGLDNTDGGRAKLLMPAGAFNCGSLERPILLFTELCGPSVHEFARSCNDGRMPWSMARRTIDDTLTAVQFLHERGIGHGDIQSRNLLLMPMPSLSAWGDEAVLAFLAARKPIMDQRPGSLSSSDTQGMMAFFKDANIRFDGSIKLADFGSGFVANDGSRRGDLGVRGDVESPERMEQKDWGLPADMWSVGCTVLELLTGKLLFKMLDELMKKWSDELGLQMLRNTLGSDSASDDSARPAVRDFLLGEYHRSDVTSHEVGLVEEMAAQSIRWRPETRSGIVDIRRIWDGERSFEPTQL